MSEKSLLRQGSTTTITPEDEEESENSVRPDYLQTVICAYMYTHIYVRIGGGPG